MAQGSGVSLASNVNAVAAQSPVSFVGGRCVIVADGSVFPTTCQVQIHCKNGSWASVGANLTAAGISSGIDLPAGEYRLNCAGGTATALYVDLVRVPY